MAQAHPDATPGATSYVGLRTILDSLQAHADATGIRTAAREVGMSPSGLQKVLNGASPYQPTRHKLEQWYYRHLAGQHDTARDVALRILLRQVPRSRRAQAHEQIAAILRGDDPCARP